MPLATTIPQTILETIVHHLAQLFLAATAGDETAARQAAADMLAAYRVETQEELALAAEIVSFRLHSLEALGHAAAPDLSLNKILRLRGGAVSLSREAHKSQRKLDQLQRDRRAGQTPQPTQSPPRPKIDKALGVIEAARTATQANPPANLPANPPAKPKITWSQSFQKRQMAQRIAENAKKNQARHASQAAHPNNGVPNNGVPNNGVQVTSLPS